MKPFSIKQNITKYTPSITTLKRIVKGANKYIITTVLFAVIILFTDEYSVMNRYKNIDRITKLEKEVSFYQKQIDGYKQRIEELDSDNENLEKYAREQFFMKRPNEDLFIIK